MYNLIISLGGIFMLISVSSLIGRFFDIKEFYYMPFIYWGIALFIFNIFLDKQHQNIFMKNIEKDP